MTAVQLNIMDFFGTPVFGISLSIFVYLIGMWLFKITNGFFLIPAVICWDGSRHLQSVADGQSIFS